MSKQALVRGCGGPGQGGTDSTRAGQMHLLAVAPWESRQAMNWVHPVLVGIEEARLRSWVKCQGTLDIVIVGADGPNLVQGENLVWLVHPGAKAGPKSRDVSQISDRVVLHASCFSCAACSKMCFYMKIIIITRIKKNKIKTFLSQQSQLT